ncbi:type II secretion system F family protein [Kocuria sp. SM24M-10]|uniref:type II secretion system F family protein n=1 Tax=Kocuria sp. SM24M-10 TaxID=1660349 RepID=UPI00064AF3D1|nr:type II secretion system F family protein [Kocuria sp. SM24M-10]KLU11137.1 secretion system protein [Kocuria sp. SM24M-10]
MTSLLLGPLLLAGAAAMAIWLTVGVRWGGDRVVRENLRVGLADNTSVDVRDAPNFGWAQRFTTDPGRERLESLYSKAGRPADWPVTRLMACKIYASVAALLVSFLLLSLTNGNGMILVVTAVMTPVGYFLPELLLYSRGVERQREIGLELADTLDQMMIAVEAGLGFESAMSRAGHGGKGPLAEELVRTLQEMRVGIPRREAYLALEQRTDVPDLRQFTRAVIQADAYGISIASVLRTQADEMRVKRRQRAEEAAQKIPTKIVIPLMLFILPVLFLTVLGPAFLNFLKMQS